MTGRTTATPARYRCCASPGTPGGDRSQPLTPRPTSATRGRTIATRPDPTGVSPLVINALGGVRVSASDGYVEARRARGVRARLDGRWVEVRTQHVVLCAGAIHSPAILLRSGNRPGGSISSLPVGEGLQDHLLVIFWLLLRREV